MFNMTEAKFQERCENIRKEIEKEKGYKEFNPFSENPGGHAFCVGKIEGLEYCYNLMKSI